MTTKLTPQAVAFIERWRYDKLAYRYSSSEMRREAIRMMRVALRCRKELGVSTREMVAFLEAPDWAENREWVKYTFVRLEHEGRVLIDDRYGRYHRAFWVA